MSKKVHSRRAIVDTKDAFLELVRHYRQNFSPWYYAIKLEGGNPHSFVAALGISSVENLMRMLVEFGVATKFGENHCITSECGSWIDADEKLGESFGDKESFITRTKSPKCTGDKKQHLFVRLGKYADGDRLQITKLQTEEGRKKVQSDGDLRRLQRSLKSKVSHMCNLKFSTGTYKKKGPHDEAGDGEDDNDSTTTNEMSFMMNIKKHVASNFAKDLNRKLVEGYVKCGVPQIDLVEIMIGGDGRSFTKYFPIMDFFNIPLIPVIIMKLLQNIAKLNQMYPDLNLLSFDTFGGDAMNVLVASPQTSTREVFTKNGSRATICKITEMMVNHSELKNIENEEDKKKETEEETPKRTKWTIESFMKNDQRVANIITDIARDELGLIRN